jgi:hypothetical protein
LYRLKPLAPLLAWPLLCLALILAGTAINVPVQQLPWAFPAAWDAASLLVMPLGTMTVLLAVLFTLLAFKSAQRTGHTGVFAEWIVLQLLVFSSVWIILPAATSAVWIWVLGLSLITGTALLMMRSKGSWPGPGAGPYFSRQYALVDGLIVLLPLLAGVWASEGGVLLPASGRLVSSLLLYPLYALFQLGIFLAVPATRMIRMGYSPRAVSTTCAIVFCLAHWPNPLLMAGTGIAMFAWAGQFLRGRSILVLALIMGLAATGVRYVVPAQWTLDMRIGPDYIEKRAAADLLGG